MFLHFFLFFLFFCIFIFFFWFLCVFVSMLLLDSWILTRLSKLSLYFHINKIGLIQLVITGKRTVAFMNVPLNFRYCGQTLPPQATSTGESVTIVFQSDSSISHEGFSVTYVTFDASQCKFLPVEHRSYNRVFKFS